MAADFEKHNTQVLGASFDTVGENAAFAKELELRYPLLCDTERKIGMAYGACDNARAPYASRISYLISPDRKILKVYDSVNPTIHPAQVLLDLEKLE